MKSHEIKAAIADKGYTLSMIAEALGVNLASVSGVVCGHTQSRRIANAICKIINKPIETVFPDTKGYHTPLVLKGDDRKHGVAMLQQLLAAS
ncbi:helix-turn-helix domain-containing protein [Pseudoalteromonas sp. S16_S37]|uniref:helix-turn-helix domain-containing protein n=1 Tax=Pseudoalteromonas sp. S16_S37 TaxID=2720228 RepID=UPI0016804FB3|nr:helix-turn-helix domain-containing protein [Pseudoalteromonas sp. S16_S37]MBD1584844.1 transcriptional regulator [Pseudoalteromonas sp. S16_S37]MBD1584951.1 transcriptional regulator [Pseudoalteromonas sp. S16_S37]